MPLPENLEGEGWTEKIARAIFPWLIWLAKNRQTIYYSDLDAEVVRRRIHHHVNFVQYGHPAGTVGNALELIAAELGEDIPPLNALVVAKTGREKGLPSDGCDPYLARYLDRKIDFKSLSATDKRAIVAEVHEAVFSYEHWDDVQGYFADVVDVHPELSVFDGNFLAVSRAVPPRPPSSVPWDFEPPERYREQSGPESPQHKALKEFVARHPELLGLPRNTISEVEKTLGSGDRLDVCFTSGDYMVAAEIKSEISPPADILKGVFQCVKYRALIRAHQKLKRVIPNGEAVLVVGQKLPDDVRAVASLLSIVCIDEVNPKGSG